MNSRGRSSSFVTYSGRQSGCVSRCRTSWSRIRRAEAGRVDAAAREEGDDSPQPDTSADDRWYVGSRLRNSGSLHADIWTGTGAELADSGYIGITPVGGWWKENNRKDRADLPVRYALLVSLRTDEVTTDIYTPIATQIGIPVAITT